MDNSRLHEGAKIHYTGDMANQEGWGRIIRAYKGWYPLQLDIELFYDYEHTEPYRVAKSILPSSFEGSGRRFELLEDYEIERKKKIIELEERMAAA